MDLFEYMRKSNMEKESPLAARMRPTTLDEVVGQQHIIGKDKLLYRAIKADKLSSIIFYGPPGTGKTTRQGDRQHHKRGIYPDQRDGCGEKGHGRGGGEGKEHAGYVRKAHDPVY